MKKRHRNEPAQDGRTFNGCLSTFTPTLIAAVDHRRFGRPRRSARECSAYFSEQIREFHRPTCYDWSASHSAVLDRVHLNNRNTSDNVTQRSDSSFVNSNTLGTHSVRGERSGDWRTYRSRYDRVRTQLTPAEVLSIRGEPRHRYSSIISTSA